MSTLSATFLGFVARIMGRAGKDYIPSGLHNFKVGVMSPVFTFARITKEPNWRLKAGVGMCRSVTLGLIYREAAEDSKGRALGLMWTEVEIGTTLDLVEVLTLRGACHAEVTYSTGCTCTRCGTGYVEKERTIAPRAQRTVMDSLLCVEVLVG